VEADASAEELSTISATIMGRLLQPGAGALPLGLKPAEPAPQQLAAPEVPRVPEPQPEPPTHHAPARSQPKPAAKRKKPVTAARPVPPQLRQLQPTGNGYAHKSIRQTIESALAAMKRPGTTREIYEQAARMGSVYSPEDIARNIYAARQAGTVRRTEGTEGMGAGITWELTTQAQQQQAQDG